LPYQRLLAGGLASAVIAVVAPFTMQAQAATVPVFDHVFLIVMENHSYGEIIGNTGAPYVNSLVTAGALATNYTAVSHPSLPNYLALTGGSTFNITSDCTTCWVSASNIGDSLDAAGSSWKAYEESMPSACFVGDSYPYAQKHDPLIYFNDIRTNSSRCQSHIVPYTQLATDLRSTTTTPSYSFITPNMCNDMHDCSVGTGDAWLQQQVPAIMGSPAFTSQRSLLAITWDEDDSSAGNQVATIFLGSGIVGGAKSSFGYDHYSLLRTLEAARSASTLTANDAGATPMADLLTAVAPPPPPPPSGWLSIGSGLTSAPETVAGSATSEDLFARGSDQGVWQIHWNGTSWASAWTSLGGTVTADVGAANQGTSRIDLFARGSDSQLYHRAWNGTAWAPWSAMGGILSTGPDASVRGVSPAVVDVWVAGSDGQLYHRWSSDGGTTYGGWQALGGFLTANPAAVSWSAGRVDVFARGTDHQLYHRWWSSGGGWSAWQALGGILTSAPEAISCTVNHLDIFVRGSDNGLWRKGWNGSSWSGWQSLGGAWASSPSADCRAGTGTVDLFAEAPDGSIWQTTVTAT
jgi:phosphatidylinositol-3-phosphatase